MISNERKKFQLRSLRSAPKYPHELLSNFVLVFEQGQGQIHYVRFSEDLVEFVGNKLPRGIAIYDPAYLEVKKVGGKTGWEIWAVYHHDNEKVLLWKTPDRPAWLKPLKAINDVDSQIPNPPSGG